ncbi:unnamed protein product, partial [marine sediment metagenome]
MNKKYDYFNIHCWQQPEKAFNIETGKPTYLKILSLFETEYPNARLLDVGCGNGNFHFLLKERGYKNVVGIDFSKPSIDMTRKNHPEYEYHVCDVCKTFPFKDNSFDVVVSADALEHVISPRLMIGEMLRTVKPSGYCVIRTPNGLRHEFEVRAYDRGITESVFQHTTPMILKWMVTGLGGKVIYINFFAR